jgi:hypothetical protein
MPQTYYLGGRTPLVSLTAALLALAALALLGWLAWGAAGVAAWLLLAAGSAALVLGLTAAGLWWRLEWARRLGVACLLALMGMVLAMPWSLDADLVWALAAAVPVSVLLGWLVRRLVSAVERQQFSA